MTPMFRHHPGQLLQALRVSDSYVLFGFCHTAPLSTRSVTVAAAMTARLTDKPAQHWTIKNTDSRLSYFPAEYLRPPASHR